MEIDKQLFLVYLSCFVLFWLEAKTPFWRLFTTARQRGVRMRQEDWWELQSVMWWVVHRKHDRREPGSRIKIEHAKCCVIVSKDVCESERVLAGAKWFCHFRISRLLWKRVKIPNPWRISIEGMLCARSRPHAAHMLFPIKLKSHILIKIKWMKDSFMLDVYARLSL